jgi:hypothetical protein
LADLGIQADLIIDCPTGVLERAFKLALRLRKQAAQQPVIQVKDFVGDSGTRLEQYRNQHCVSALIGKISKIVCRCLSPLAGETQ